MPPSGLMDRWSNLLRNSIFLACPDSSYRGSMPVPSRVEGFNIHLCRFRKRRRRITHNSLKYSNFSCTLPISGLSTAPLSLVSLSGSSRTFAIISRSAMSTTQYIATLIGLWLWSRRIQSNVVNVQCTTGTIAVNPNGQLRDILQARA